MNITERERIACDLLGIAALEPGGFARCPGEALHSKKGGLRDFRVSLETVPTGFCFHGSCSGAVAEFNHELRSRVWHAENGGKKRSAPAEWGRTAPAPREKVLPKRPPFEQGKLETMAANVREVIDAAWLMARSPVPVTAGMRGIAPDFFETLYEAGEKVLVFTEFASQGQFGYHVGHGGWRIGKTRGVKPVKSDLPLGAAEGVWYLCNPVCGEWRINHANVNFKGEPKWGRRHGDCVTAWRYLVLESDVASPELWLKLLVQLPLRIAAIYTSGGKSLHALVRVDAASKAQWDAERNTLVALLAPLGADAAAMTAVRLTRLPGCLRGDRLQELWYLDPKPQEQPIYQRRRLR